MRTRRAIVVSGLLGVLVLAPVLAIVILGAYGTALGGSTSTRGESGASLTLLPAGGPPGEAVSIQGRGWPARTDVVIFLSFGEAEGARVRLGDIVTSRTGTFEMQTVVPSRLVAPGMEQVFFAAEAEDRDGVRHEVQPVAFALEPYPNGLRVEVVDAERQSPLAGVLVEVRDAFGLLVAAVQTDPDGAATIDSLVPGTFKIAAQKVDFAIGRAAGIEMEVNSIVDVRLDLPYSPGRRLYVLAFEREATGQPILAGIDRASGLAVEGPMSVLPGRDSPVGDGQFGVYFNFMYATGDGGTTTPLLALGTAGRLAMAYSAGNPTITRYAGESATGIVALTSAVGLFAANSASVVTLDRDSGRVLYRREVPTTSLTPVISADGTSLYVGDWLGGSVRVLDAATGDVLAWHREVVETVRQIVLDGKGGILVMGHPSGIIMRLDPVTGVVGEPLTTVPGVLGMALDGEGRLLLFGPNRTDLIIADAETGESLEVVPLQTPAGFVWPDPEGPFLIVGFREGPRELTLQVLDASTYETVQIVKLPLE
ncbi:MAG: carboxypeptidase regulatory-like domain-containing protein [Chloroflexota bacterium]|nr:carboxypeptidase regulatory-like domain-containing protein [Chloroflexota bacterium]MDP6508963.1 carboxypeptidase regulatory-like domain-containing protein [Chloroflexota bacterium]MDP6758062.1 carboxypeptidase regulatory-like domain-containing protein [Chloroflexota bacterium]